MERWALVLAGGDGRRLQELTRRIAGAPIPKQYCRIAGDRSLLEATLARVGRFVPPARTLVIVTRGHLPLARSQLGALPAGNVLVQPKNRDTGPGMLFSLLALARRQAGAQVAVFPSDHWVGNDAAFVAHVERASRFVEDHPEKIALLGIRPDRPDPGYGYVVPAQRIEGAGEASAFQVAHFVEKPAPAVAEHLIRAGALWNAFVMVFRVDRLLALVRRLRPADLAAVVGGRYEAVRRWNFSSDLLAHIPDRLVTFRVDDTGWSDWGTEQAIERTFAALDQVPPWRDSPPRRVAG
jgi:mannose-1-phosphate guanylyltransferase